MIHVVQSVDVAAAPDEAFAYLDDLSQIPSWLDRCAGIEKLTPGPNAVGTKLLYAFKEGRYAGTMDIEITAHVPNQRLAFLYEDKFIHVVAEFQLAPHGEGTRLTHAIELTPKSFRAKLFAPLIRRRLPTHMKAALEALRAQLTS